MFVSWTNVTSPLHSSYQKQPVGNTVDKIVSGYQIVYGSQMDEDVIFSKCRNAISCVEKVDKEISTDANSGMTCTAHLVGSQELFF